MFGHFSGFHSWLFVGNEINLFGVVLEYSRLPAAQLNTASVKGNDADAHQDDQKRSSVNIPSKLGSAHALEYSRTNASNWQPMTFARSKYKQKRNAISNAFNAVWRFCLLAHISLL